MQLRPDLDSASEIPLYRQLGGYVQRLINAGELQAGDRLPPTRELAGQLGLNRTTVSAAYEWLESEGLIQGAVGRGSFVLGNAPQAMKSPLQNTGIDWSRSLTPSMFASSGSPASNVIDFSSSRPSEHLFPLKEFRECVPRFWPIRGFNRSYNSARLWVTRRCATGSCRVQSSRGSQPKPMTF